jgi:methyltransferase family protein
MSVSRTTVALGEIAFSPGAEEWVEFGPADARERVGFHDYAGLYAVPGLYERVFYDELGMCSAREIVALYAGALRELNRSPRAERALDLGAGNGLGGQELRRIGVGRVLGVDLEPQAREAAWRDRPGVYDEYLVGDLAAFAQPVLARLQPTAVLALSALGPGHAPPTVLDRALGLLPGGGLFGFAVTPTLLPESDDPAGQASGYPAYLRELFADRADELARHAYVHRRRADGSEDLGVAFIGKLRTIDNSSDVCEPAPGDVRR